MTAIILLKASHVWVNKTGRGVARVATRPTHLTNYFDELTIVHAPFLIPDIELHMVWS